MRNWEVRIEYDIQEKDGVGRAYTQVLVQADGIADALAVALEEMTGNPKGEVPSGVDIVVAGIMEEKEAERRVAEVSDQSSV